MGMSIGDDLRVTIFGESHGKCVGALIEGMPPGTPIEPESLARDLSSRKPGRRGLSQRMEMDECEILSGVFEGKATGWPILLVARNSNQRPSDYDFLPDHPRPGHADMVEEIRLDGSNDPRGGGSQSARLTLGLVAAGSQVRGILGEAGWKVKAHLHSVGNVRSRPLFELDRESELNADSDMGRLNCRDSDAVGPMSELIESVRMNGDTIGSSVEIFIDGLPIGMGEPWFDGLEPALARGLMAIPGARAIEFSHGFDSSSMLGSEHNDAWSPGEEGPVLDGSETGLADGALGGRSTGSPISIITHFKPPSSLPKEQLTLHLPSNEKRPLKVGGRHDPVIGPRAAPVAEAVAMLVICDLGIMGGYLPALD